MDHKNIHEAIVAIMGEVGYVQKQKSQGLSYSYASEAALIAALRPVMLEHGVYISVLSIVPNREQFTTTKGSSMNSTLASGSVRFFHAPTGTFIDVMALGEGMDSGDKSANKASTGLLKYALRQTFLIETGDDPDSHPSAEQERKALTPEEARLMKTPKGAELGSLDRTQLELLVDKSPALAPAARLILLTDFNIEA